MFLQPKKKANCTEEVEGQNPKIKQKIFLQLSPINIYFTNDKQTEPNN